MRQQGLISHKHRESPSGFGTTLLRVSLLFGSIIVALSLVLVPTIIGKIEQHFSDNLFQPKLDRIMTGGISPNSLQREQRRSMVLPLSLKSDN